MLSTSEPIGEAVWERWVFSSIVTHDGRESARTRWPWCSACLWIVRRLLQMTDLGRRADAAKYHVMADGVCAGWSGGRPAGISRASA